jgi:hypothetical protein
MAREKSGCVTGFNETPRQGCAIAGTCAYDNGYRLLILHAASSFRCRQQAPDFLMRRA